MEPRRAVMKERGIRCEEVSETEKAAPLLSRLPLHTGFLFTSSHTRHTRGLRTHGQLSKKYDVSDENTKTSQANTPSVQTRDLTRSRGPRFKSGCTFKLGVRLLLSPVKFEWTTGVTQYILG